MAERPLDVREVGGSNPSAPTKYAADVVLAPRYEPERPGCGAPDSEEAEMSNITKHDKLVARASKKYTPPTDGWQCGPDGEVDIKTDPVIIPGMAPVGDYGPTIIGKTGPALPKTELIHKI